jgi:hypothetical protein
MDGPRLDFYQASLISTHGTCFETLATLAPQHEVIA